MGKYHIVGGNRLYGEVQLQTSKNALLPMMAAGILSADTVFFQKTPKITDVLKMAEALRSLGALCEWNGDDLRIDYANVKDQPAGECCGDFRGSVFLLGALLGRFKRATLPLPGGCKIGSRPVDIHMAGFTAMGCQTQTEVALSVETTRLKGARIRLRMPSVGATENLMIAGVSAEGKTVIENAAKEPEVVDLSRFLSAMGASVEGAGTEKIAVVGGKSLHGTKFEPMKDRIEGGTFLAAFAACGGEGCVVGCKKQDFGILLDIFAKSACKVKAIDDKIYLSRRGCIKSVPRVETAPFPGFPTDMQSQMLPMFLLGDGKTEVRETLFENRFLCARELRRFGAHVREVGDVITLSPSRLFGAEVAATDLRCGAGLSIAALCAQGESVVGGIEHVQRGYAAFPAKLRSLGADIEEIT